MDGTEEVRQTFVEAEKVENDALSGSAHRREGASHSLIDDGGESAVLPRDFPVQPLGQLNGKFYFLTARGEFLELSAGAMNMRANLVAMFSGCEDPIVELAAIAEPGRRDQGFNPAKAADVLMQACSELPIFDPTAPMRHFGVWRGKSANPVVHLGEEVLCHSVEKRRGRLISGSLYPAVPSRASPSDEAASVEDLTWVRDRIQNQWSWVGENDADLVMGWIGQAALGQFPSWRTHMYVKGKHGSGKSTLTRIVSSLLGGMSTGVKNSSSAAAIRQTTNRMALARVFDEAEADEAGSVSDVIALFRLMSDAEGAQVERGTSDHSGVRFELYGAGYLSSIIPAAMTPADKSRFVILTLRERKSSTDPTDQALYLAELQADAQRLGPMVWSRMLSLAPSRWDETFRVYNGLVQSLGARARTGDTVGAILAGWDLMLFDEPLVDVETKDADKDRMERAKELAQPLISAAQEAEEQGEGDRCLNTIFAGVIHKDHGGVITASECIEAMQEHTDPEPYYNKLIGRLGLRMIQVEPGKHTLFVANGGNPLLDKVLSGSRWRSGGHRAALETIDEVRPHDKAMRVAGRLTRGLIVPARFLPGGEVSRKGDET